jgi:Rod binding domain-containing protein
MPIPPLQRQVNASDLPLERLAGNQNISQADKIAEVSRQFEAVLLRQILGSAQKTVFASSINPKSVATDVYQDMITEQLADRISHSGAFGLARSLEKQLGHELKTDGAKEEAVKS